MLYGSQAQGDAHPESDIDLLVVLHGDVRPYDEIKRTSLLGMDLLLDHELSVSMHPYILDAYETAQSGYMQNVRGEGIEL